MDIFSAGTRTKSDVVENRIQIPGENNEEKEKHLREIHDR